MHVRDAIAKAVADAFRLVGVPAVYTPHGGDPLPVTVIFEDQGDSKDGDQFVAAITRAVVARVRATEVSLPAYQDSLEIDGESWTVMGKTGGSGGVWTLDLRRSR